MVKKRLKIHPSIPYTSNERFSIDVTARFEGEEIVYDVRYGTGLIEAVFKKTYKRHELVDEILNFLKVYFPEIKSRLNKNEINRRVTTP